MDGILLPWNLVVAGNAGFMHLPGWKFDRSWGDSKTNKFWNLWKVFFEHIKQNWWMKQSKLSQPSTSSKPSSWSKHARLVSPPLPLLSLIRNQLLLLLLEDWESGWNTDTPPPCHLDNIAFFPSLPLPLSAVKVLDVADQPEYHLKGCPSACHCHQKHYNVDWVKVGHLVGDFVV